MTLEAIRHRRNKQDLAKPVTVSLPAPMLDELDAAVEEAPYGSRSDAIRAALIEFLAEQRLRRQRNPSHVTVFAICFNHRDGRRVAEVKHTHGESIRTTLHTHLEGEDCVEIFVASGPARQLQALHADLNSLRGIHLVRRTQIPSHVGALGGRPALRGLHQNDFPS